MTKRTVHTTSIALATMLAACSQGQSTRASTAEATSAAALTGDAACDEYLSLARECIAKERFTPASQRRNELLVVERSLRGAVHGERIAADPRSVWSSITRGAHAKAMRVATVSETPPPRELCKLGIDQLPPDCQ